MSDRTRRAMQELRLDALDDIVQRYLDKLEWMHPSRHSRDFEDNSAAKWACKAILREIHYTINELPFILTPIEVLNQFSEKMKRYSCDHANKEHSYFFAKAAETAEYLEEEYWQWDRQQAIKERHT